MIRTRGLCISGSLLVLLAGAVPVRAELYKDAAIGLSLLDFRFSGQRNVLGDGITVNANAVYNNRKFDFGYGELTLNGAVNLSGGFTRRGIPGADFTMNTGGVPLSYDFQLTDATRKLTATGAALIDIDTNINALGFYDEKLEISNRGTFKTSGLVGGSESGTLDFDAGPIDVSGNIFGDLLAAITQPFYDAAGTENPFAKFSQKAAKLANATKSVEELQARALAGETLTDQELSTLINNSIIAAVLGGKPSSKLLDDFMVPKGFLESQKDMADAGLVVTPEPVGLITLVLALAASLHRRRRTG